MKTVKRVFLSVLAVSAVGVFALGSFNSFIMGDKTALLKNDLNIKFAKNLDDLTGKVVMGRMAASIPQWDPKKDLRKKPVINMAKTLLEQNNKPQNNIAEVVAKDLPEPAITSTPELTLTGGLYKQNPLINGKGYSGSARIVDGIVEEINVRFPDGETLLINTTDAMIGNVFQYEDSNTRKMKSGLAYPIKDGRFMITLTDDSKFSNLRLEFSSENAELDNSYEEFNEENLAVNETVIENQEQKSEEYIEDNANSFQAQNGEAQDQEWTEEEWSEQAGEEVIETTEAVKASTFSFKFASMN